MKRQIIYQVGYDGDDCFGGISYQVMEEFPHYKLAEEFAEKEKDYTHLDLYIRKIYRSK